MANHIKSTKRTKREMVIPFEGEEMLVVPKKGGFGQPDMEGYVMAVGRGLEPSTMSLNTTSPVGGGRIVGSGTSSSDTPVGTRTQPRATTLQTTDFGTLDSGGGVRTQTPTTSTPTPTTFDPSGTGTLGGGVAVGSGTNLGDAPVGSQAQPRATTILQPSVMPEVGINTTITPPNRITYGDIRFGDLPSGGSGDGMGVIRDQSGNVISSPISNVPVTEPTPTTPRRIIDTALTITEPAPTTDIPPMEIPTFPSLSNMNCAELNAEISRLSSVIAVSRFPINVANAYNNQLALAQTLYTTKCPVTAPAPPTPVIPVIPVESIGGGGGGIGGGFGGGGGGMAPEEELPQEEVAPKQDGSRSGILLLLAVVGGLYLLTRR